jgi:translation initiation factor IF-2
MKEVQLSNIEQKVSELEQAGAVVILPPKIEKAIDNMNEKEQKKLLRQREKAREEMKDEFDEMLARKDFSVSGVENMVHSHGFDLDDLEDLIHGCY